MGNTISRFSPEIDVIACQRRKASCVSQRVASGATAGPHFNRNAFCAGGDLCRRDQFRKHLAATQASKPYVFNVRLCVHHRANFGGSDEPNCHCARARHQAYLQIFKLDRGPTRTHTHHF